MASKITILLSSDAYVYFQCIEPIAWISSCLLPQAHNVPLFLGFSKFPYWPNEDAAFSFYIEQNKILLFNYLLTGADFFCRKDIRCFIDFRGRCIYRGSTFRQDIFIACVIMIIYFLLTL